MDAHVKTAETEFDAAFIRFADKCREVRTEVVFAEQYAAYGQSVAVHFSEFIKACKTSKPVEQNAHIQEMIKLHWPNIAIEFRNETLNIMRRLQYACSQLTLHVTLWKARLINLASTRKHTTCLTHYITTLVTYQLSKKATFPVKWIYAPSGFIPTDSMVERVKELGMKFCDGMLYLVAEPIVEAGENKELKTKINTLIELSLLHLADQVATGLADKPTYLSEFAYSDVEQCQMFVRYLGAKYIEFQNNNGTALFFWLF